MKLEKGLVQVYTGNGKGKTTAALGLALRAVGHNFKVLVIQFLKASPCGELNSAKRLQPTLKIEQFGRKSFVDPKNYQQEDKAFAREALQRARRAIQEEKWDIVVLDEINIALSYNLISLSDVLNLIKNKPEQVELILTGRNVPQRIIEVADLVSEIKEIKHPYQKGVAGRKGIEY